MRSSFLILSVLLLAACAPVTVVPPTVETNSGAETATGTVSVNDQTPQTADSLEVSAQSSTASLAKIVTTGGILTGTPEAAITLTIFDDYACAYCRQFALSDLPWIEQTYIAKGQLRIERVFVPMSVSGETMARIALCSEKQQLLTETDRELHTNPLTSDAQISALAKKLKLNLKSLQTCMTSDATTAALKAMADRATSAGVERVPTFQLGTDQWVGLEQRDVLQKKIEEALE